MNRMEILHADDTFESPLLLIATWIENEVKISYYISPMGNRVYCRRQHGKDIYWYTAKLELTDLGLSATLEATRK